MRGPHGHKIDIEKELDPDFPQPEHMIGYLAPSLGSFTLRQNNVEDKGQEQVPVEMPGPRELHEPDGRHHHVQGQGNESELVGSHPQKGHGGKVPRPAALADR